MDSGQNAIFTANADITAFECDVLVLKYAQGLYGADKVVAHALGLDESDLDLCPDDHQLVPSKGKIPCSHVLFVGVEPLCFFGYYVNLP